MMVDGFYDGFNQSEKKDDNLVLEKEKENVKHDYKAQIEENVLLKDKLKKTSNSLKNSDKEASKAYWGTILSSPGTSRL